jgi:integrase
VRWAYKVSKIYGINMHKPLTETDLCMFACFHAREKRFVSCPTLFSALADWHQRQGFGELPRHDAFRATMKGLTNLTTGSYTPKVATAITFADLRAIHKLMDPNNFEHARDWAILTNAFFSLLRSSEYVLGKSQRSLQWREIHRDPASKGLRIDIRFSKTSASSVSVHSSFRDDIFCPDAALRRYAEHIPTRRPTGAVFTQPSGRPLTQTMWGKRFHFWIASIGLPVANYTAHSLRRGGATAMFQAGVPIATISKHGRWISDAVKGYNDFRVGERRLAATRALC